MKQNNEILGFRPAAGLRLGLRGMRGFGGIFGLVGLSASVITLTNDTDETLKKRLSTGGWWNLREKQKKPSVVAQSTNWRVDLSRKLEFWKSVIKEAWRPFGISLASLENSFGAP